MSLGYRSGAHASIAVGLGTLVFLEVLHHDFHEIADKAFQAFAVPGGTFPESFKEQSLLLWSIALYGFGAIAFLSWVERDSERKPFDPKIFLRVIDSLRDAWDGILMLIYFATIAGASLAGLVVWAGGRLSPRRPEACPDGRAPSNTGTASVIFLGGDVGTL